MTEQQQERITTTPAGSDTAGVGVGRSIVPAPVASSSEDGLPAMVTADVAVELATAAPNSAEATDAKASDNTAHRRFASEDTVIMEDTPPTDKLFNAVPALDTQSWVSVIEEEEQAALAAVPSTPVEMDVVEERTAYKRKKCRVVETDSLEDSASDLGGKKARPRTSRKKATSRSLANSNLAEGDEDPGCSTVDNAPSGTDQEEKRRVGRPRRKVRAIDPILVEQEILQKTGKAPDVIEEDMLSCMTISDISAQALDYVAAIEIIRQKCGRLQGGLSGELRKRTQGLGDFIRALQMRAESQGDPHALQLKIDELLQELKENKKEEERRKREISELQDTIKELRKENKSIRIEMRRSFKEIRESLGKEIYKSKDESIRKDDNESIYNNESIHKWDEGINVHSKGEESLRSLAKSPATHKKPVEEWPLLPRDVKSPMAETADGWVYRPPLQGKSTAIPIRNDLTTTTTSKDIPSMVFTSRDSAGIKSKRSDIKVISDVQIMPPRKERLQREESAKSQQSQTPQSQRWETVGKNGKILKAKREKSAVQIEKKKLPKTAAISLKGNNSAFSYADALKKIRTEISLQELDIQMPRIRRGISGNTIIEITGPDNALKADRLATEMQRVLKGEAYISRPIINGEIRLIGMDESITIDEINEAISTLGNCKLNEIRSGRIGRTRNGAGIVWIQCPKATAITLAEKKRIPIGWSLVRVELLKKRPTQCHRCWQIGHVRVNCKASKDYSGCCFRCGVAGHSVSGCKNQVRCMLCFDTGVSSSHRMGSARCTGFGTSPLSGNKIDPGKTEITQENKSRDHSPQEEVSLVDPNKEDSPDRRTDDIEMEEI